MSFKNPITYLSSTRKLSDTCIKDLELKQMYNDLLERRFRYRRFVKCG